MKSPEKGLDLKSNPFFRVNLCLLLQIALGILTRILKSQTLESETYTTRLGRGVFLPPLLPSRTDEHVSRIPLPSIFLDSCFEKKEKEPKKNGKRTEKERNSVTTAVGRLPVEGEKSCRAKDQSVGPTVRKRRPRTAATSNRKTGCKDTKIKIK